MANIMHKNLTGTDLHDPKAHTLDSHSEKKLDTLDEKTADAGVTIEGCLIKDGNIIFGADKGIKTLIGARAYLSADQSNIPDQTWTKVLLDTEDYDLGSDFASYKFTVPITGYYLVVGSIKWDDVVANKRYIVSVYKNGAATIILAQHSATTIYLSTLCVDILYLTAGDYLELYGHQSSGVGTVDIKAGSFMSVFLLSRA